jgi:uncharacterized protein YjiS (DUF1127 family)
MANSTPVSLSLPFSLTLALYSLKRPAAVWKAWRRQAENRCLLTQVDDHLCKDIGVSADTLIAELRRPWWRDPQLRRDLRD